MGIACSDVGIQYSVFCSEKKEGETPIMRHPLMVNKELPKVNKFGVRTTWEAMENNIIVGFAGILILPDSVEITNIVVKKNKRNKGIGGILLERLINEGIYLKKDNISLEVNENNSIAIGLYEKNGFKKVGLRKKYYNGIDNAINMTKKF